MARTACIVKEQKKVVLAERNVEKRSALKKAGDFMKLSKLKRNTSRVRVTKRCRSCGRPRGVYRKFALCRICLREAVMRGDVPGAVKSSW